MAAKGQKGFMQEIETMAELRRYTHRPGDNVVHLLGYHAIGDGGGGFFRWEKAAIEPDDFGTVIEPRSGHGRWKRFDAADVSVKWFGAKGDHTADDLSAFQAAVRCISTPAVDNRNQGPKIVIPPGTYLLKGTLVLDRRVMLSGAGMESTFLRFVLGNEPAMPVTQVKPGIDIRAPNCVVSDLWAYSHVAARSRILGEDGILVQATCRLERCWVSGFGDNGIHIRATHPAWNANCWYVGHCRVSSCHGNGLYTEGNDANAGLAIGIVSTSCSGVGIFEDSDVGNTYIACEADACGSGISYQAKGAPAKSMFIACYAEGMAAKINLPNAILGGWMTPANDTNAAWMYPEADGMGFPNGINAGNYHNRKLLPGQSAVSCKLGGIDRYGEALSLQADGAADYTLFYGGPEDNPGWWQMKYGRLSGCAFAFSTRDADVGHGWFWFPSGFLIGNPTRDSRVMILTSPGAGPADFAWNDGKWNAGDRVLNTSPMPGGFDGWICVEGATESNPKGEWKRYGRIDE
jgi:hypothetical protein